MTMKLEFNIGRWLKGQGSTIEDRLRMKQRNIAKTLDYDICISFMFNDFKNILFTKAVYSKDFKLNEDTIPQSDFLNKRMYDLIKQSTASKKVVENHCDKSCTLCRNKPCPVLEGIRSEAFIPLFNPYNLGQPSLRVIGCLYLASYTPREFPFELFTEDRLIEDSILDISNLIALSLSQFREGINVVNMIDVFVNILQYKERFLPNHSHNVANWCREIGMELGYSSDRLSSLVFAGVLHDAGKAMIDSNILSKTSELTEEEYEIVKRHPIDSFRIAKNLLGGLPKFLDVPEIVKYHHERYDGKGYPYGLKEDEVPFDSYIIGIADAVDAMLADRPYKKAMPLKGVIRELYRNKGRQFHPRLVDIMVERLSKAQKQLDENLFQAMGLSSLIISCDKDLTILEGTLIKLEDFFVFKPNDTSLAERVKMFDITNVELAIKDINMLNYYQVKLEDFIDDRFYISSIKLIPSTNTFNLLWNLDGVIYHPVSRNEIPVEITRIGGDALSFNICDARDMDIPYYKALKVRVLFEDHTIEITGNVVKSYDLGPYRYFELRYTNIPDSRRDAIYRQLFRKQIELRKAISEFR